jgi:hypothetical protein
VIAVDGKTLRGSKKSSEGKCIWSRLTPLRPGWWWRGGQSTEKNDIAIPELLDMLNLKGAVVSMDAMGTQKEIIQRILDKGADYELGLKDNRLYSFRMVRHVAVGGLPIRSARCARRANPSCALRSAHSADASAAAGAPAVA